jgi:hypothetical protein
MKLISRNRAGREPCPETDSGGCRGNPVSEIASGSDDALSRVPSTKQIKITCNVGDFLSLDSIVEFQGEFKKHDQYDIENIIKSLLKYGINFPFFIWQDQGIDYCLDGHGRKIALQQLRNRGYKVPDIPIVYIIAKDKAEAIQKLLRLNSRYGTMTEESVGNFIGEMAVEFNELSIPDIGNIEFMDTFKNLDEVFRTEAAPKERPVKRCPYCGGVLK